MMKSVRKVKVAMMTVSSRMQLPLSLVEIRAMRMKVHPSTSPMKMRRRQTKRRRKTKRRRRKAKRRRCHLRF